MPNDDVDPNTLTPEEYAAWKRKHVMEGVVVSETEAAAGLGYASVDDFRYSNEHFGNVTGIVEKELKDWFGNKNHGQIATTIASRVVDYFIAQRKASSSEALCENCREPMPEAGLTCLACGHSVRIGGA